jgi:nucleolar MIF4G domain-containing protein 1
MNKQFLSRKLMRKNKRKEKKQIMDLFYKNKHKPKKDRTGKAESNQSKNRYDRIGNYDNNDLCKENEDIQEYNNIGSMSDEEINSSIASLLDSEDNDEYEIINKRDKNIKKYKKSPTGNNFKQNSMLKTEIQKGDGFGDGKDFIGGTDNTLSGLGKLDIDDIDKQVELLENKLGFKEKRRYDSYKKRLAIENHDADLMDFLDGIDSYVHHKAKEVDKEREKIGPTKPLNKAKAKDNKAGVEEPSKLTIDMIKYESKLIKCTDNSEEYLKLNFQKEITALFNKISEANHNLNLPDFLSKIDEYNKLSSKERLLNTFNVITKISQKLMLDPDITNLPITSCICSYISIIHYKFGNQFILYFFNSLIKRFEEFNETNNKSGLKNFIFVIIQFYIFQNLSSKFYYDIIKLFLDDFNDVSSELLLILLNHIGIEIRKEDPESLKEIISNTHVKYNTMVAKSKMEMDKTNTSTNKTNKMKYIVDMIDEIKNNKYLKFNSSERFAFFKNFVNVNKKAFVNTGNNILADKIDLGYNELKQLDINNLNELANINLNFNNDNNQKEDLDDFEDINNLDNEKVQKLLKKFKMTTDLKKKIFTAIISSSDYIDAFERLTRLNLKQGQEREIIKIIALLAINEKCYNPFYKLLIDKLIFVEKSHRYTFHYTIWDYLKIIDSYPSRKIYNLANLISDLLLSEKIGLPVFLPFSPESAVTNQRNLVSITFDKYFEKSTTDKTKLMFARLVKNDSHIEFAKQLFNYFLNLFKKEISFDNRSNEYLENFKAATKVLKKVL